MVVTALSQQLFHSEAINTWNLLHIESFGEDPFILVLPSHCTMAKTGEKKMSLSEQHFPQTDTSWYLKLFSNFSTPWWGIGVAFYQLVSQSAPFRLFSYQHPSLTKFFQFTNFRFSSLSCPLFSCAAPTTGSLLSCGNQPRSVGDQIENNFFSFFKLCEWEREKKLTRMLETFC